ncbi:MAG: 5-(carboxyamino)imidazole ribonucleotide mutase [Bdellovibrionota bacterium]
MSLASTTKKIAVLMGSTTDWEWMQKAVEILKDFEVGFHAQVLSAHRSPQEMLDFAAAASQQGYEVLIAGAGGAAHLPGMLAARTTLPVIGVPCPVGPLAGQDALHSIVQMPKGVPVATVGIGNAANAALLAIRILAIQDKALRTKLEEFAQKQHQAAVSSKLPF